MLSKKQIGSCPPQTSRPSLCRPLYPCRPLIAVGFLTENDHYCQNQTIRPANDVWLRTTTPLPVAYELNERTGSQDRKSTQKERRKYTDKHTLQRERGTPLENWQQDSMFGAPLTGALHVPVTPGLRVHASC